MNEPVRTRLLILKLDHIGDLLIAAPALMLLRKSFASAHITLVCAPWNVGLARRLGIADEIHGVEFFSSNSVADLDHARKEEQRRQAIQRLVDLQLAAFDLAIDLRRDEDTRELLKLFESRRYAGFGDLSVFSYLDVALPFSKHGSAAGATYLNLGPSEFDRVGAHQTSNRGLHLTSSTGSLAIALDTDQLWAPGEDGEPDWRKLGVALWRIDIAAGEETAASRPMQELSRDNMQFGPGWLEWEPWGRWSSITPGQLTIKFPAQDERIRVALSVQGHTSPSHDRAVVRASAGKVSMVHEFRAGDGPATLVLDCQAEVQPPTVRSDPILLRGGRYHGALRLSVSSPEAWVPLTVTVRTAGLNQVLAKLRLPETVEQAGLLDFPFEVEVKDTAEPLIIELRADHADSTLAVGIASFEMAWMQGQLPHLPVTHMDLQLLDLAAMVALRFGDGLARGDSKIAERLRFPREGSTATEAINLLQELRERPIGPFWRRRRGVPVIGIGIGANKETKLWPRASFVALSKRILKEGCTLAFIGGPQELAEADAIIRELGAPNTVLNLCAASKIEDLGEILGELDAFVGLDTGTTHFAGRVGLKTFALFGASHDPLEWGPVGARSGWAVTDLECAGCSLARLEQCPNDLACMTMLTPERVWPALKDTLLAMDGAPATLIVPDALR